MPECFSVSSFFRIWCGCPRSARGTQRNNSTPAACCGKSFFFRSRFLEMCCVCLAADLDRMYRPSNVQEEWNRLSLFLSRIPRAANTLSVSLSIRLAPGKQRRRNRRRTLQCGTPRPDPIRRKLDSSLRRVGTCTTREGGKATCLFVSLAPLLTLTALPSMHRSSGHSRTRR